MKKKTTIALNFIDVFAGAGGLSCGLEQAGHRCLLGIEQDKFAASTFLQNHPHAEVFCGNIYDLSTAKLKTLIASQKINAVVGGPPCQGFSTVGCGDPKDKRNSLFMEFFRIVKICNPEFIVIENVTGIVAQKNEQTLSAIFTLFSTLGYNLDVQVLSAHHYGVAEKRRRTIILGSKINDTIIFPTPTSNFVTVGEAFLDLKDKTGTIHNHDLDKAKVTCPMDVKRLKKIPEGKGIRYELDEKKYLPKSLQLGVDWQNLKENRFRQTKYHRLDRSLPSPTIMTNRCSYFHPTENRYLTQREAARLQSFPNDFIFTGPVSSQWRQIGNAVPPLLAKSVGQCLSAMYVKQKSCNLKAKNNLHNKQKVKSIRKSAFIYRENNLV